MGHICRAVYRDVQRRIKTVKRLHIYLHQLKHISGWLVKWGIVGVIVGASTGAVVGAFLLVLYKTIDMMAGKTERLLLLPFALTLSLYLSKKFFPMARGASIEQVINLIHSRHTNINPIGFVIIFITTVLTIGFGGSAGKAGPAGHIGASFSSLIGNLTRWILEKFQITLPSDDDKWFIMLGISGAFATVFGTPVAGGLFALEVVYMNYFPYNMLYPNLIAGYSAFFVAKTLYNLTYITFPGITVPKMGPHVMLLAVMGGIIFGMLARLFIDFKDYVEEELSRWHVSPYVKAFTGGVIIAATGILIGHQRWHGLGTDTITAALKGEYIPLLEPIGKIFLTSITLSVGGTGGLMTPLFFVGATSGNILARLMHSQYVAFGASLGFAAVAGAAANAPLATIVMVSELFGAGMLLPASLAVFIAFEVVGPRSIYPSQIVKVSKDIQRINTARHIMEDRED